jgi:hypothetical protein
MASKPKKITVIRKVSPNGGQPQAPHVAEAPPKPFFHLDNIVKLASLFIALCSLMVTLLLSWDQLASSREERERQKREAIRLELEERYRVEEEKKQKEEKARLAEIARLRADSTRKAEAKAIADAKAKKANAGKKAKRKKPLSDFFRKLGVK